MVRIRRSQTRRSLGRLARRADTGTDPADLALIEVVDSVEEGPEPDGRQVTV